MRIYDVKINGITNPVGFSTEYLSCSWKVAEALGKRQSMVRIVVAKDAALTEIVWVKEGRNLSSIGEILDFVTEPRTRYYYQIMVVSDKEEVAKSEVSWFESGKKEEPWKGQWITTEAEDKYHPVFGKSFPCEPQRISGAKLYISALGLYEAYLNGEKIGNDILAPFCNDYHAAVQYQTYDVTELLREENQLEIKVGNGWYKGRFGLDNMQEIYGDKFMAIGELHLHYNDGTEALIATDDTWEYWGSEIEDSGIYDGEIINHLLWEEKENPHKPVRILADSLPVLVERYSIPVIEKEILPVQEVLHTPAGELVLDMGQNFTGYVSFYSKLSKGTKLVLDFGEILQNGNFYRDNYRSAKSQFVYVSNGKEEWVRPHFTYFGFRYVRVTGLSEGEDIPEFIGKVVYSDLSNTMEFTSSHEKLNRLMQNCLWGQKSNFLDMPTDCPQRDERMGWTGDAQVFAPTASFQMDTRAFYRKFLRDLRVDQVKHEGEVANYLPNIGHMPNGSSVWGDIATILPMTLYQFYGDKKALVEFFPMMQDWVDYITGKTSQTDTPYLWTTGFHFGDWLALDGITEQSMKGATEDTYIASMYYYKSACLVAEAAAILSGEEKLVEDIASRMEYVILAEKYNVLAENIKKAILDEYFTPAGRLAQDTQTAYLLSLNFKVYRSKAPVLKGLKLRLKKDGYKIKGGFVGATTMCQVLAANGMGKEAYHLLLNENYPGWLHCVNLGATTIWERWNSVLEDGRISGTGMNSLNHYAYGTVMEFVYRYIAGITENAPGFTSVKFAPQIDGRLKEVSCKYDSLQGVYQSAWKICEDGRVWVRFEVPFGGTAKAILPGTQEVLDLEPGVYENTYTPEKDFRNLYSMESRLEELAKDERAMGLLKEKLPVAFGLAMSGDAEHLGRSLEELQFMNFMGFSPEIVKHVAEEILKLR